MYLSGVVTPRADHSGPDRGTDAKSTPLAVLVSPMSSFPHHFSLRTRPLQLSEYTRHSLTTVCAPTPIYVIAIYLFTDTHPLHSASTWHACPNEVVMKLAKKNTYPCYPSRYSAPRTCASTSIWPRDTLVEGRGDDAGGRGPVHGATMLGT
jgi:hypothetical protein